MNALTFGIEAMERGLVPDALTRAVIRVLCGDRLKHSFDGALDAPPVEFLESLHSGPIALATQKANEQHYELPPEFFAAVLGPQRKYSCCYFAKDTATLAEAEERALALTCEHAELADGQEILELGCGWGSLSLWMAEHLPNSRITSVSNSSAQRRFIEAQCVQRGVTNLRVTTSDMNDFSPGDGTFDRIVSVEMFEHMRNYDKLLQRIASWLRPAGKVFIHVFCHRTLCYPFETDGPGNWMGRHFFTGGLMPSADLLRRFPHALTVTQEHCWNGQHYQRTAEAWLVNLDANRADVLPILASVYGSAEARRWFNRWRTFFLAVAELFGCASGEEWFVSHYLMQRST